MDTDTSRDRAVVVLAVVEGLRAAFMERLAEWAFATIALGVGMSLAFDGHVFDLPEWALTRMILGQEALGWITIAIGLMRLAALAVNGAWRPTYHLRALFAGICSVMWFSLGVGFYGAHSQGIWVGILPALFFFDAINMRRAIVDAVKADRAAMNRRAEISHGSV